MAKRRRSPRASQDDAGGGRKRSAGREKPSGRGRSAGKEKSSGRDRASGRGGKRGKSREYVDLEDLDREEERGDRRGRGRGRGRKSDATVPIIIGVGAMLVIIAIVIFLSQASGAAIQAREVVKDNSDIGAVMQAVDVLIRENDKEGMHWALRNFERQLSKSSDEDKAKWRGTVGKKIRDWASTNNQDDYREIEKYMAGDSAAFVGNQKDYDRMIDMLRNAEDDVIQKVSKFEYFKVNVFPKMDLDLLQCLPNQTVEETKRNFMISAKHTDYSKIGVKPIDRIYLNMKNPRIRTEIKYNDLKYFYQFTLDVHMKKQGDKMVIDTFSLVESGKAKEGK